MSKRPQDILKTQSVKGAFKIFIPVGYLRGCFFKISFFFEIFCSCQISSDTKRLCPASSYIWTSDSFQSAVGRSQGQQTPRYCKTGRNCKTWQQNNDSCGCQAFGMVWFTRLIVPACRTTSSHQGRGAQPDEHFQLQTGHIRWQQSQVTLKEKLHWMCSA